MKTTKTPTELKDGDLDEAVGGAPLIQKALMKNEAPLVKAKRPTNLTAAVRVDENGDPIFDYPDDFAP